MYFIGSVIKKEREKNRISQEELSFGICAVSTLSRIEHNEQTPSMEKAMALLERLGLEGSSYLSFVSEEEYRFYGLQKEVEKLLANRQYREAYEYVSENEEYLLKNNFRKQFLLSVQAAKVCYVDERYETAIRMTEEAVRYTCPLFDKSKKITYLLTNVEVNVINMMAVSYWKSGECVAAINLLMNLADAVTELHGTPKEREHVYPMLLCNLSKWLCSQLRFAEAEHYAKLGRNACIQSGRFRMLPYFCCSKAAILQSRNSGIDEIMWEYISAYVLFENMEMTQDAGQLHSYVLKAYNRDLKTIDIRES